MTGRPVRIPPAVLHTLFDEGWTDEEIAAEYGHTASRVQYLRRIAGIGCEKPVRPMDHLGPDKPVRPLLGEVAISKIYAGRRYEDAVPEPPTGRLSWTPSQSYVGCAAAWVAGV